MLLFRFRDDSLRCLEGDFVMTNLARRFLHFDRKPSKPEGKFRGGLLSS